MARPCVHQVNRWQTDTCMAVFQRGGRWCSWPADHGQFVVRCGRNTVPEPEFKAAGRSTVDKYRKCRTRKALNLRLGHQMCAYYADCITCWTTACTLVAAVSGNAFVIVLYHSVTPIVDAIVLWSSFFSDLHSKIHLAFSSADNVLFSRRTLIKILSLFHSCVLLSEWRNKIRQ